MRKHLATIVGACTVIVVMVLAVAGGQILLRKASTPDRQHIRGSAACVAGNATGVWVETSTGHSGFASWYAASAEPKKAQWHFTLPEGGEYQLHVGCGGDGNNWTTNNKTVWVKGGHDFLCHDDQVVAPSPTGTPAAEQSLATAPNAPPPNPTGVPALVGSCTTVP